MKLKLPSKSFYFNSEDLSISEIFHKSVQRHNFFSRSIGCNVLSEGYSPFNPVFAVMLIDLISYLMISFQNIYAFRDDFDRLIFCTVTLPMGFQCCAKAYAYVYRWKDVRKIIGMGEKCFKVLSQKYSDKLQFWILVWNHIALFMGALLFVFAVLIFSYPIIYYFIFGEKILHFGFILPGTDTDSLLWYTLNFLHHTFQIYAVPCVILFSEYFTTMFLFVAFTKYDLLELLIGDLNALIEDVTEDKRLNKIKICFADITDRHVELIR